MEIFYDLQQVCLIPSQTNGGFKGNKLDLSVMDAYDKTGANPRSLPVFTSPMESIVDAKTAKVYVDNNIKPVIPLTENIEVRLNMCQWIFCAFTMSEIEKYFGEGNNRCPNQFHICIEEPNSHSEDLLKLCRKLKHFYGPNILIMAGPVGTAETIIEYAKVGINYMRVGLASGSLADSGSYGFHYPTASLLEAIGRVKKSSGAGIPRFPMVVVDGGIESHSDIIKALALGADYVMIGKEFASCIEAAGPIYTRVKNSVTGKKELTVVSQEDLVGADKNKAKVNGWQRNYCGCSSPEIRAKVFGFSCVEEYLEAREMGLRIKDHFPSRWIDVDTTLGDWIMEFENCAQYAMTMTNSSNWSEFISRVRYAIDAGSL